MEYSEQLNLFNEINPFPQNMIVYAVKRGSNFENGKQRIYDFFKENHTPKEKIDFLKNEYGTGGSSPLSEEYKVSENHGSHGIELYIYKTEQTRLIKWSEVVSIIDTLISTNSYLED